MESNGKLDYIAKLSSDGRCIRSDLSEVCHNAIQVVKRLPSGFIAQWLWYGSELPTTVSPNGTYSISLPKELVAGRSISANYELIFFPLNNEHARLFSRSRVCDGGPSQIHPGSAAVLSIQFNSNVDAKPWLLMNWLQYSFREGSPPELNRSLVSKYLGARTRLLETALEEAASLEIRKVLLSNRFCINRNNPVELKRIRDQKFPMLQIENSF